VSVLLAGMIVTGTLTAVALALYNRNENRLLGLRARQLGLVLSTAVGSTQTPLAAATALADATDGNVAQLRLLLAPDVGPGKQFVSAFLWPLQAARPRPIALLGEASVLAGTPRAAAAFFTSVGRSRRLSVIGILHSAHDLRLGYGYSAANERRDFAIYAESALPANRRSRLSANSAFADLHYALYFGHSTNPGALLVTDLSNLPVRGRHSQVRIPFGDNTITVVVTPNGSLGGTFFQLLPVIIALAGLALTAAATILTQRLVRGRRDAEELARALDQVAAVNRQLYAEQRSIAQSLQHALLPERLPELPGLSSSSRFVPGVSGIEIGGDWYDLTALDDGSVLLVVGDVSGQGVRAATTMAALRHAVLAYAARGDTPAELLSALARLVDRQEHDYFATVLCAQIDVAGHHVTAACAGHLPPLVIDGDQATYVSLAVGVPIGAGEPSEYQSTSFAVPAHATLLAFTDGLIERRDEALDAGLERLRTAATAPSRSLEDLVGRLVDELSAGEHDDDTTVLAVRWTD
jgi:serine phosphatase RsbU (regulator of sigma subunit)